MIEISSQMEKLETPTFEDTGGPTPLSTKKLQKQLSATELEVPLMVSIWNPSVAPKLVALNWKSRLMSTAPTMTSKAVLPAGTATVTGKLGGVVPAAGGHSLSGNSMEYWTGIWTYCGGHRMKVACIESVKNKF